MDKIAVLVPCYNEGKTIEKVVTDFKRVLPEAVIYVYDNNSTDGTAEIAAKAGAVVRHEYYQGKGNVIRRMFQEVDAECYLMVDGDDTYPAESAREMADKVLERNVDMVVGDRPEGSVSKLNTYSDGIKVIGTIVRLFQTYRPLAFFGTVAAILMVLAIGFFIPVWITYADTGMVPNFPTLIVCGFVALASIQSFFAGLILQTMYRKNRQDFEMQLHDCYARKLEAEKKN